MYTGDILFQEVWVDLNTIEKTFVDGFIKQVILAGLNY